MADGNENNHNQSKIFEALRTSAGLNVPQMSNQGSKTEYNATNMNEWLKPTGPVTPVQQKHTVSKSNPWKVPSGDKLQERVINYLTRCSSHQAETITIAKALGFNNRKGINPTLYKMEKTKILQKIQDSPPKWKLCKSAALTDSDDNVFAHKRMLSPDVFQRDVRNLKRKNMDSENSSTTIHNDINKLNVECVSQASQNALIPKRPFPPANTGLSSSGLNPTSFMPTNDQRKPSLVSNFDFAVPTKLPPQQSVVPSSNKPSLGSTGQVSKSPGSCGQASSLSSSASLKGPPPSPAALLKSGGIFGRDFSSNTVQSQVSKSDSFISTRNNDNNISQGEGVKPLIREARLIGHKAVTVESSVPVQKSPTEDCSSSTSSSIGSQSGSKPIPQLVSKWSPLMQAPSRSITSKHDSITPDTSQETLDSFLLKNRKTESTYDFECGASTTASHVPSSAQQMNPSNFNAKGKEKSGNPFLPSPSYYKHNLDQSAATPRNVNAPNFKPKPLQNPDQEKPQRAGASRSSSAVSKSPAPLPHELLQMRGEKPPGSYTTAAMGNNERQINVDRNTLSRTPQNAMIGSESSSVPTSALDLNCGDSRGSALSSLSPEMFSAMNKNAISTIMEWAQARGSQCTIDCIGQRGSSHRPL